MEINLQDREVESCQCQLFNALKPVQGDLFPSRNLLRLASVTLNISLIFLKRLARFSLPWN